MGTRDIIKYAFLWLWLLFFVALSCAEADDAADRRNDKAAKSNSVASAAQIDSLIGKASAATMEGEFDSVIVYARALDAIGRDQRNDTVTMYGALYLGQTYLMLNRSDSTEIYLQRALELALKHNTLRVLTSIYNAFGIYAVDMEMNHHKGLEYFLKALDYADSDPHKRSYAITLGNLAMTYYMRKDPAGLKYALLAYDEGQSTGDEYSLFIGEIVTAYMYYLLGENSVSLEYLDKTLDKTEKYNAQTEVYSLYANNLYALGRDSQAEDYYRLAVENIDLGQIASRIMTCLSYATYLIDHSRDDDAIPLLEKGIELSIANNNSVHRYLLYEQLSRAMYNVGDKDRALEYYHIYHAEADSIFNVERERSINELHVKYEAEKRENEINRVRMGLMQEQKKVQFAAMGFLIILIAFTAIYILYRRKNKMYKQIVMRQHELINREKHLELPARREDADVSDESAVLYAGLFQKLEELVRTGKIYKDNELTIEKLVELLQTNRTYLSRAINQHAGTSFYNYINSYRIDEAVRLLSDADNDMPLKAIAADIGFNNMQTFYRVFQTSIGMPPSKYREKSIELYSRNSRNNISALSE